MLNYFKAGAFLAIVGSIIAGYLYVKGLQEDLVEYSKANAKYEETVNRMQLNINMLVISAEEDKKRLDNLLVEMSKNRQAVQDFEAKISDNDVDNIVQKKPKLFEKLARKGTVEYYEQLKEITAWSK